MYIVNLIHGQVDRIFTFDRLESRQNWHFQTLFLGGDVILEILTCDRSILLTVPQPFTGLFSSPKQ